MTTMLVYPQRPTKNSIMRSCQALKNEGLAIAEYGLFKINLKLIRDYPNIFTCMRHIYHYPGIIETINFNHIKQ